ncbi:MAG: HEAT repeat domain-containing protein, partial [Verrucomicrobiaceae bacterium]|nr:HEAT repeat domain-containing protein [Verrucomicrobiaceae bacterium]
DKVQQLLIWRGDKSVAPHLEKLAHDSDDPLARLHALCTLDGLGALAPGLVERALTDPDPGVRENALRLAETRGTPAVVAAATQLVADPQPKVVLQLACTLGAWKDETAGRALGALLALHHRDRYILAAVMSSAVPHLRAVAKAAAQNTEAAAALTEPLLDLALALGDRDALAILIEPLVSESQREISFAQIERFAGLLDILARRSRSLAELTKGTDRLAHQLLATGQLFVAARKFGADASLPALQQITALSVVAHDPGGRTGALPMITHFLAPQHPPDAQRAAIRTLAATEDDTVPALFFGAWKALAPELRMTAIDQLLSRDRWALALLAEIGQGRLPANMVDASRRERLSKHPTVDVRAAAKRIFTSEPSADRAKTFSEFGPALTLKGDAARGAAIYAQRCASCHRRGEIGQEIGPDLRSVVAHEPARLLAAILDPSADVQPGYHAYHCRLASGEQLYGIIASETATNITIRLADATTRNILRNEIATLESANLSFMPQGLEAGMTAQEMADLITLLRTPLP